MVLSLERFLGKVAIVTGASAGIGAAIVEQLVEAGLIVVGLARRIERLEELSTKLSSKKGKFHPFKADITQEDQIKLAFEYASNNFGPVHILINNAGLTQPTNLSDGNTEMWARVLNTNILGLCIATREAVRIMKANNIQGHIIHINSVVGHSVPYIQNDWNVYAASKHAVTALTETLRQEFNRDNVKIKITSLSPGAVETEFIRVAVGGDEELGRTTLNEYKKTMPFLKSEDIADGVLYVLSTPPHVQVHELILKPVGESF